MFVQNAPFFKGKHTREREFKSPNPFYALAVCSALKLAGQVALGMNPAIFLKKTGKCDVSVTFLQLGSEY